MTKELKSKAFLGTKVFAFNAPSVYRPDEEKAKSIGLETKHSAYKNGLLTIKFKTWYNLNLKELDSVFTSAYEPAYLEQEKETLQVLKVISDMNVEDVKNVMDTIHNFYRCVCYIYMPENFESYLACPKLYHEYTAVAIGKYIMKNMRNKCTR